MDFIINNYVPQQADLLRRADSTTVKNSQKSPGPDGVINTDDEKIKAAKMLTNNVFNGNAQEAENLLRAQLKILPHPTVTPQPIPSKPNDISKWHARLDSLMPGIYPRVNDFIVDNFIGRFNQYRIVVDTVPASVVNRLLKPDQIATFFDTVASGDPKISFYRFKPNFTSIPSTLDPPVYKDLQDLHQISGKQIYITDPSQKNKIVSEGQGFWLLMTAALVRAYKEQHPTDTNGLKKLQEIYNGLLSATQMMIFMGRTDRDSDSAFPAWEVQSIPGKDGNPLGVRLPQRIDPTGDMEATHSASDADMDIILSLLNAQKNVDDKTWSGGVDYGNLADRLIARAQERLFHDMTYNDANGYPNKKRIVMKPSEDWEGAFFTDYLRPYHCQRFAEFLSAHHGKPEAIDFWQRAARDSMSTYQDIFAVDKQFHPNYSIMMNGQIHLDVKVDPRGLQGADGMRSPMFIAQYMMAHPNDPTAVASGAHFMSEVLDAGIAGLPMDKEMYHMSPTKVPYNFPGLFGAVRAMYLPASAYLNNKNEFEGNFNAVLNSHIPTENYFEWTLMLLALTSTFHPDQVVSK